MTFGKFIKPRVIVQPPIKDTLKEDKPPNKDICSLLPIGPPLLYEEAMESLSKKLR